MYSISYISWLQLAAEYGGCSQLILMSPLTILAFLRDDLPSDLFVRPPQPSKIIAKSLIVIDIFGGSHKYIISTYRLYVTDHIIYLGDT